MQTPTRILVSADTSTSATGLGKYCHELCKGLHNDDNFVVAEQGNFGNASNISKIDWKYYPVEPDNSNKQELFRFSQDSENRYGKWIFEKTLLDFKPDFVIAINDPWMFSYQGRSPLRNYYHWCISPTIDSMPQRDDYLSVYSMADSIFTYTDWAMDILQQNNIPNTEYTIRMGIDKDIFKPCENRADLKERFGLPQDAFIIGTVMRNQRRKLIPDIIEAFSLMMERLPEERQNKTFLYLHTTYPDIDAWDLPQFLLSTKFSKQILFTYFCKNTETFGCSRYQDAKTYSFCSGNLTLFMPSGKNALSNNQLADVFNLMDLYIQVASCEGFGVPIIEAAACGVDCAVINYSGMEDAANNLDLITLDSSTQFYNDNSNRCKRVFVDYKLLADELLRLIEKLEPNKINYALANKTAEKYSWTKCIELWKKGLNKSKLTGLQGKWNSSKKYIKPIESYPLNLSNSELVEWCYENMMPFSKNKYGLQSLIAIRDLHYGIIPSKRPQPFDRDKMFNIFQKYIETFNHYEDLRTK